MISRIFLFAVMLISLAEIASACPAPSTFEKHPSFSSALPSPDVPRGMLQLKVQLKDPENAVEQYWKTGKISFVVRDVVHGEFSKQFIVINAKNSERCRFLNWPYEKDFYISVFPLQYKNLEPILDRDGNQEYGSFPYDGIPTSLPDELPDREQPKYVSDTNEFFSNYDRMNCLYEISAGGPPWSELAWRKCVRPSDFVRLDCQKGGDGEYMCEDLVDGYGRPADLRHGYSHWYAQYGVTFVAFMIFTALIILAFRMRNGQQSTP